MINHNQNLNQLCMYELMLSNKVTSHVNGVYIALFKKQNTKDSCTY